jgi:hypothetical protein
MVAPRRECRPEETRHPVARPNDFAVIWTGTPNSKGVSSDSPLGALVRVDFRAIAIVQQPPGFILLAAPSLPTCACSPTPDEKPAAEVKVLPRRGGRRVSRR